MSRPGDWPMARCLFLDWASARRRRHHHEGMTAETLETARALAQAVLRHAELVAGGDATERQEAGRALVSALDAYGVAVINSGSELPEDFEGFDEWLGEEDGIHHPEPEADLRQRIALFTRTDLAVTDIDLLRTVAASRLAECCGDTAGDLDPAGMHPADAVSHLVGHEPTSLEPDTVEAFGLDLLSWTSTTIAGVTEDDVDDSPWAPLLAAADDDEDDGG